jgi:hypothetical protein
METAPTPTSESDENVVLLDKDGKLTIVEIKTRSSDPKQRDYAQAFELTSSHKSEPFEVWFFLIERLKLLIIRMVNGPPDIKKLPPLDVWEKTESGIFDRSHVILEVEICADRVNALFRTIEELARRSRKPPFRQNTHRYYVRGVDAEVRRYRPRPSHS